MEQPKHFTKSPPFRATQLWNEAVSILENGMPMRRHFYRMRYYDNCFSGKEAIEWLSRTLISNPRFGQNVTTSGTRKLLQHFLKTGIFQSVKGSLTFKDSGLYEFVDRTIRSPSRKQDHKLLYPQMGLKEVDQNVPSNGRTHPIPGEIQKSHLQFHSPRTSKNVIKRQTQWEQQQKNKNLSWKDFILKRIEWLVPSLSVELLVDPATLQSDWVMYNVCPQFTAMRKKTELPFWVFTAITSVIRPQEKDSEYTTYSGFEKEVYSVVRDYLRHRSSPVIPYHLYELFMYTFNHLHYLDLEMKNQLQIHESVENLVLSMSHEWNEENLLHVDDVTKTVLPPNSCFETAFTSDEPVTRIVPQSSVDTICLPSKPRMSTGSNLTCGLVKSTTNILRSCKEESLSSGDFQIKELRHPSPIVEKSLRKFKGKKKAYLRRTQSMALIDSKWNTLPLPQQQHQSYVNFGLSQSMDDLLVEDEGLDLEAAMQSVNCLLRASCNANTCPDRPRPHSPCPRSCTDSSSASYDSLTTVGSSHLDKANLVCIDSCMWFDDIQDTARQVFQLILTLMSPASRTALKMLLQFVDRLPVPPNSSLTKTEMVYDLSAHILSPGPHSKNVYSHHLVLSVVYFLVDNCNFIFEDLPYKDLLQNNGGTLKENKEKKEQKVFCEQLTKNQFEDQGLTSSWLALAELLDQIINDNKMKSKEKKKRLKKFKEAYPHIYKQRFGGSTSNLASLMHFR